MPKGIPNKKYTGEFKQMVVETMRREHLSCNETEKRFEISKDRVRLWERIYLEEGPEQAFAKIPDNINLLLHSDQGWHYRHKQYVQVLQVKEIQQSMSRKGNCYDNSVMENFFGHLKSELLYLQEFEAMDHFKAELIEYIDYYNNRRIKARLKGLPPALHRQQALLAA